MKNEKRLIDANALSEFFQERYEYLRNTSEKQLPNGYVQVDLEIQCGAIIAKEFLDKTKDAPTVDAVEVVHGRWKIDWEYERDCITGECEENPVATCPFCGHKEYGFAYDEYWGKPYNYCPNCGAKMDGGNEDG